MNVYVLTAVDLRTGLEEQHTIAALDARSAVQRFADAFPHTRVISARPRDQPQV